MIKSIEVDLKILEGMLYFWYAASDKENVSEQFFYDLSEMDGFKLVYESDFNSESVRKVLSAIKNRELLSNATQKEKRFWNYNMWVMEDLEYTNLMISPIKKLNLNHIIPKINETKGNSKTNDIKVIFAPLHMEDYYIKGNCLIINFFKVKPSDFNEDVFINEKLIEDYILEKILEMNL